MNLPVRTELAVLQPIELYEAQAVPVDLLRLDLIHPVISGNKWFKLSKWLEKAQREGKKGILTAGGPYSNHIVATACAAAEFGLPSAAIIGAEPTAAGNSTLREAAAYGMVFHFVPRSVYRQYKTDLAASGFLADDWLGIPEGGQGPEGVAGAASIADLVPQRDEYTHIVCAAGTGTMAAGLAVAATPRQKVIVISSLKGEDKLSTAIRQSLPPEKRENISVHTGYHFGGYAKHPQSLLDYMNQLYRLTEIPTDIVYTSKMIYALEDLLKNHYFPPGSKILAIHSGGLQGNRSLPAAALIF